MIRIVQYNDDAGSAATVPPALLQSRAQASGHPQVYPAAEPAAVAAGGLFGAFASVGGGQSVQLASSVAAGNKDYR